MSGFRIDWSNPWVRGGLIGAAVIAVGALNWTRIVEAARRLAVQPPLEPTRVAVVTADGFVRLAGLLKTGAPDRRLWFLGKVGTPPLDDLSDPSVWLTADRAIIIYHDTENFSDGFDARLLILSSAPLKGLFYATDNSVPQGPLQGGWWSGRDPAAPSWLKAYQASSDADWAELVKDQPELADETPWEIQGRFDDAFADGYFQPEHMTVDGALAVKGSTMTWTKGWSGGKESAPDDFRDWWGVIGPQELGWEWLARGPDALPAQYAPAPAALPPPIKLALGNAGALLIDGVAQTHPQLAAGVLSADAA